MFKRVLDSNLPLMVYPPTDLFHPAWFAAVCGAGALPVLDGARLSDRELWRRCDRLGGADGLFGLRLPAARRAAIEQLTTRAPANLVLLVLAPETAAELQGLTLPGRGFRLLVEALEIRLAEQLAALDADGVIVRGTEAPGRGAVRTAFVLMQWYLENAALPVFVHGGVGWHTAAGLMAAGAAGLVLDNQLYLADESGLAPEFRELLQRLEENDSVVLGHDLGRPTRLFAKLGTRVVRDLKVREIELAGSADAAERFSAELEGKLSSLARVDGETMQALFYLGQDTLSARHFLANGGPSLTGMLHGLCRQIGLQLAAVEAADPLVADSPLAGAHGTRYPIIQGPMANVSDNAAFAAQVLEQGGLPFLAMGSLPAQLAEKMLTEGVQRLPRFGAGMIGIETFNATIRRHMELVKHYKAPFALFAGGVPAQVRELEESGTRAYLHTPSLRMLENALSGGCTGFIFEGGEAGGHVGVLTSLVLWQNALDRLSQLSDAELRRLTLIFAGGIGTRSASFFVSGMTAALAARGAKIGIQVGTAYLFTREIVESGAIKPLYQQVVCQHDETIVMGTTVGLASRTVPTPFAEKMTAAERERLKAGQPLAERKHVFEQENIGSLLIGAKAFCPDFSTEGQVCYINYTEPDQLQRGNFMCGEGLAFADSPTTIAEVHARFFEGKPQLARHLDALERFASPEGRINDEIAIIGMGCVLPGAANIEQLWQSVLARTSFIQPMPAERLDPELYVADDRKAEDRSYSRIAGVVSDFVFDHDKFGYSAEKAARLSRSQQMVLEAAWQAGRDADLLDVDGRLRGDAGRTAAVVVATCLGNEMTNDVHLKYHYPGLRSMLEQGAAFRAQAPERQQAVLEHLRAGLARGVGYEPVHGALLNIEASRIARHLGIEGANYVVDAACATSFAAIDCAVRELLSGAHDLVVVGGVNTNLAPESFVGFSKMGALSAQGSFPFDARADGFVLGEGAGAFVLKRARDARRDGNRILGIIKGIGGSSDGKGKAIAAPSLKGQRLALERCFNDVRTPVTPADVDYVEAHGTATVLGDKTEVETLRTVYGGAGQVGISSIKSQVGHLLGAAGAAGLAKALLALRHHVLPPNGPFETPAQAHGLDQGALFVIREAQPWPAPQGRPRRAAVSSYGFGGINYHLLVEEPSEAYVPLPRRIFADPAFDFNGQRIVVAGMGVVLPGAVGINAFWRRLEQGGSDFSPIPRERFDNPAFAAEPANSDYHIPLVKAGIVRGFRFDNARFRIPPTAARSIDRAQLFALEAASQAIQDAGLGPQLTDGNRVGVILGTIPGGRQVENILRVRKGLVQRLVASTPELPAEEASAMADELLAAIRERLPANSEDTIPGLLSNIVSGRVANYFNCNGANFVVDASCASSAMAFALAAQGLRQGAFDCVLAGGVDVNFYPAVMLAFKRLGLLSAGEPLFFDKRATGYVMGEGAAVQVLTTYRYAKAHGMPIYGEIDGVQVRSSAHLHLLSPSERVYRDAMEGLYRQLPQRASELAYLDVFGVSSVLFDAIEKQAVEGFFRQPLYFGNAKTELGYFKAANPAVVLTRLMLMLRQRKLLPHRAFSKADSLVAEGSVLRAAQSVLDLSARPRLTFAADVHGVGGNHGHFAVSTLPRWLQPAVGQPQVEPAVALAKPAVGIALAAQPASGERLVALLSGQGAQYPGMLQTLAAAQPEVKQVLERGEALFVRARGYSLLEVMAAGGAPLNRTENTQPAIFLASAAIFTALAGRGFAPQRFIGHSIGEYSALYCIGALDFEVALQLILTRSEAMRDASQQRPGKILVTFAAAEQIERLLRGVQGVYLANLNSDRQTVVAGEAAAVTAFSETLRAQGVQSRLLDLSGAFHSPLMQAAAERMAEALAHLPFAQVDFTRIVANASGQPYPQDEAAVKELLVRQIVSPVRFVEALRFAANEGPTRFVEVGAGRLLSNLLKNTALPAHSVSVSMDPKAGEAESFQHLIAELEPLGHLRPAPPALLAPQTAVAAPAYRAASVPSAAPAATSPAAALPALPPAPAEQQDAEFERFLATKGGELRQVLFQEYQRQRRERALQEIERFGFYTGGIVIAGTAVGLPGSGNKVFNDNNFERILAGTNFIEPLTRQEKEKILDLNITRVVKDPEGNARFLDVMRTEEVIQLAGKLGYFNLQKEYGVDREYDITNSLAIAAGLEALKDARIPLLPNLRRTGSGKRVPDGWALPTALQDTTGVIMTSLFPGFETLIDELNKYYYNKFYVRPYNELEMIFYHLMQHLTDEEMKGRITDWFFKIKERRKHYERFNFDRDLLFDIVPLGSAHFARLIRARGPNIQMSGACASTTQAVAVAEDWIRAGRCERVIIIGGEAATTETQGPWVGSGFLALGAATVKGVVSEAAKPFDAERDGTILGSGAVSLIVERADTVAQRGLNGQAEVLGTYIGNSAYHPTRIDVEHLTSEMRSFIRRVEKQHALRQSEYAPQLVFMSHETFTPARGGSAAAEVSALRATYPEHYGQITITNTKGYTGHTLGAAIEDAVMVKALQKGKVPPVANLTNLAPEFADLNFDPQRATAFQYGLHYSAGFGSHFSFLFLRRIEASGAALSPAYQTWLRQIAGGGQPELQVVQGVLRLEGTQLGAASAAVPALAMTAPQPAKAVAPAPVAPLAPSAPSPVAVPAASAAPGDVIGKVQAIVAAGTGYGVEMLGAELDLEADLGIDTVKQVELFGQIAGEFGLAVPEDLKLSELSTIAKLAQWIVGQGAGASAVAAATSPGATLAPLPVAAAPGDVIGKVQAIVAAGTGYGVEMLGAELDLEADLGIDTVKQVELFGQIAGEFGLAVPEDLKLSELSTIAKLAQWIVGQQGDVGALAQTPVSGATTAVESTAAVSSEDVVARVQAIVAAGTGYGVEMLGAELDLEADLGIDTVKQVELFGQIAGEFGLAVPEDLKLSELSTIAKLAQWIIGQGAGAAASPAAEAATSGTLTVAAASTVQRFAVGLEAAAAPAAAQPHGYRFRDRLVAVSLDRFGVAEAVIQEIIERGGRVLRIGSAANAQLQLEWNNPEQVSQALRQLAADQPELCGLIHLAPLDMVLGKAQATVPAAGQAVKSLFAAVQALQANLNRAGGLLALLSPAAVLYPYRDTASLGAPLMGGLAGLLKSVRKELSELRVKVVDMSRPDLLASPAEAAAAFVAELEQGPAAVEVGIDNGQRHRLVMRPEKAVAGEPFVADGDLLLVTGGARGITLEILVAMCRRWRLTLAILGRSDILGVDAKLAAIDDDRQLLAALAERMPEAKPVQLRRAADAIVQARQSAANLRQLESLGAKVFYHAVDVTDAAAVAALVAELPRVDGVLHAAGIDESQSLEKKTLDSFARVFDTKVLGAANLLDALETKGYRYLLAFSSVTARLGNAGQTDYTAANDMLAHMVLQAAAKHPQRVHKIMSWTAWEGTGMAARGSVARVLAERGLTFLSVARGVELFMAELSDSRSGEAVFTAVDPGFDPDGLLESAPPLATGATVTPAPGGERDMPFIDRIVLRTAEHLEATRLLELERDRFLLDHSRDGVPIFLGATGIEAMAEAAQLLIDERLRPVMLADFAIPYGIKLLKGRAKELNISAAILPGQPNTVACRIHSLFRLPDGSVRGEPTQHYQGTFHFAAEAPAQERLTLPELKPIVSDGPIQELLYHPARLFMDGVFRTVEEILSFDGELLISRIRHRRGWEFFRGQCDPPFVTDPVALDAMFQTGGMLEVLSSGDIVLPSAITRMHLLRPIAADRDYLCLTRRLASEAQRNRYRLELVDAQGNLYVRIEEFAMVKIDRLAPQYQVAHRIRPADVPRGAL